MDGPAPRGSTWRPSLVGKEAEALRLATSADLNRRGDLVAIIRDASAPPYSVADKAARLAASAVRGRGTAVEILDTGTDLAEVLIQLAPSLVVPCVQQQNLLDGGIQELLEVLGCDYIGANSNTTRTCSDKAKTKAVLAGAGITTPPSTFMSRMSSFALGAPAVAPRLAMTLGLPVVVKPVTGSGGIGVRRVTDVGRLAGTVNSAFNYDREVIVERMVNGPQYAVVVTGRGRADVIGAAIRTDEFATRGSAMDGVTYEPPGDAGIEAGIAATAADAFEALGCRDFARVDIIVEGGEPLVLEVDTRLDFGEDGPLEAIAASIGRSTEYVINQIFRTHLGCSSLAPQR